MLAEREADGTTRITSTALPRRQPRARLAEKLRVALRALATNVTGRRAENPLGIMSRAEIAESFAAVERSDGPACCEAHAGQACPAWHLDVLDQRPELTTAQKWRAGRFGGVEICDCEGSGGCCNPGHPMCALDRRPEHSRPFGAWTGLLSCLLLALSLAACTAPDSARRMLEAEGYADVQITGYRLFGGCLKGEDWHTGFRAVKNGRAVTGTVCGGLFSSVVRIDG